MDRSSRREQQARTHETNILHNSRHHSQRRGTDRYVSAELKKRKSTIGDRPKESFMRPDLSGDDDYVRRWLAQTDAKTDEKISADLSKFTSQGRISDYTQESELGLERFRHIVPNAEMPRQQAKGKRRHRSSSDSSILEAVVPPKSPAWIKEDFKFSSAQNQDESSAHFHKRRKVESVESESSSHSSSQQETFEKRARHKTREDRYELKKKSRNPDETREDRNPKKRREKRGDKKRNAKKAREDLMNNFSSKSIKQDRLTIRPSHGLGLFKNGRASSPARRRGLPDLAFSEMEFLQHSTRHLSKKKEDEKTTKSRDKDKQRALRTHDEISMFFAQSKTPLAETSPNARNGRPSAYISEVRPRYNKGEAIQDHIRSQSIDIGEKPYPKLIRPAPSFDSFSASRGRTPLMYHSQIAPRSGSRLSQKVSTCVTWSEAPFSAGATGASREMSHGDHHAASPTPESIRKSLEKTGIFKDMRIRKTSIERSSQARFSPRSGNPRYSTERYENANITPKITPSLETSSSKSDGPQIKRPRSTNRHLAAEPSHYNAELDKGVSIETPGGRRDKDLNTAESDSILRNRSQVLIENSDRGSWHQQPDANRLKRLPSVASMNSGQAKEPKSAPITRAQIAKDARIKYPATTLPATRVAREVDPTVKEIPGGSVAQTGAVPLDITTNSHLRNLSKAVSKRLPSQGPETPQIESVAPSLSDVDPHVIRPAIDDHEESDGNTTDQVDKLYSPTTDPLALLHLEPPLNEGVRWKDYLALAGTPIARLDNTSLAGLPRRGIWFCRLGQANQPLRVSPAIEPEPLYSYQLQRLSPPVEYASEVVVDNDPTEEHLGALNSELVPYLEHFEYGVVEEQDHGYPDYDQDPTAEDHGELHFHAAEEMPGQRTWQQTSQYRADEIESYDEWYGPPQDMDNNYSVAQYTFGPVFAENNVIKDQWTIYEDQEAEEALAMRGFWRPHRAY